jgi:hypothetical protein
LPVNSTADNLDFYVSRDESFMILSKGGMKISYHKEDGNWTNPKSLGSLINFGLGNWGPYVSADNKYLFYTTGTQPDYSDTHVYWVRIDSLMDSLRYTNFVPYVKNRIPDQTVILDSLNIFTFTVPDSTFIDDDGNNTLTYYAKLSNGNPLPSWLTFDTLTGTFSGIPSIIQVLTLKVTARDNAGAIATTTFKLTVQALVSVDQPPAFISKFKVYPNPTSGSFSIEMDAVLNEKFQFELYSPAGKIIQSGLLRNYPSIDLSEQPKGIYFLKLVNGKEVFMVKVVRD